MFDPASEAETLIQTGLAALAAGQAQAARAAFQATLRADPNQPMALTKLAEIALAGHDHARAIQHLNAALAIEPNFAPAWALIAQAAWRDGRQADALAAIRRALAIQPANPAHRLQLAQHAAWMGLGDAARRALMPLLNPEAADPAIHALAVGTLGECAVAQGRFAEADAHLRAALRLVPGLPAPLLLLGMNQLRRGDFAAGWANAAVREQVTPLYPSGPPPSFGSVWQGEDLTGRTILVADDQGFGDAIQFFRYLPLLQAAGARHITLRTFPPLVRLLAQAAPFADVVDGVPDDVRFDLHCTSSSLPRWFGTTLETIPASVPYLRPPRRRRFGGGLNIGLVWSGDPRHPRDHLRSIPAEAFLRLADLPGARFHSLQKDVRPADRAALHDRPGIGRAIESAGDFAATAQSIGGLDLIITVDTAIAHLAGALGKPVWILLHSAPDWRWMTRRTDSPWYPTARLFRTRALRVPDTSEAAAARRYRDWDPLLGRVGAALQRWIAG